MVYPNNGWRHGLIQGTIATIVAAVFAVSCASPPTPPSAEPNAMVQTLGEV